MKPSIELRDVWFGYRRGRPVLRGINLSVAKGQLVAVLGASGTGKTTLLRLVAGLLCPSQGHALVLGREVWGVTPQERSIGFVFQHLALFPNLDVRENILFGLRYVKPTAGNSLARLEGLMKTLGLLPVAERFPRELSGGQAQRVALVRALAFSPEILLLDEPFASLDRPMADSSREVFTRIHRELALTSVLVTHDWGQALTIADRVVVLSSDGQIAHDSTPKEAYESPRTPEAAALTGPVNLLKGTVASCDSRWLCVTACGGVFRAKWMSADPMPSIGAEVLLAFRPEWVGIENHLSSATTPLTGSVTQISHVGHRTLLHLSVDGSNMVVESDSISLPTVGSRIAFKTVPELTLAYPSVEREQYAA